MAIGRHHIFTRDIDTLSITFFSIPQVYVNVCLIFPEQQMITCIPDLSYYLARTGGDDFVLQHFFHHASAIAAKVCKLQRLDMSQQPLQMPIAASRLKLRLHVPAQICFSPHQSALKMLFSHGSLRILESWTSIGLKSRPILQVSKFYHDRGIGLRLEAQFPVPGHILDCQQGPVCQYRHVQSPICDENTIRCFDNSRKSRLDWIWRTITSTTGKHRSFTFKPLHI